MAVKAVIFDLDGVITDTAEYHFLSWKRLADEEGLPFTRDDNERLRGVSRRESLLLLLKDRPLSETVIEEMMARKNSYYAEMIQHVSPADLLPGVADLLAELDSRGVPYAIASASKNARAVGERLGIIDRLAALADGHSVTRQKPAPDLFRYAAAQLNLSPGQCLVVEDAAAGVQAALSAGMPALALGPVERFQDVTGSFTCRDNLTGATWATLQVLAQIEPGGVVTQDSFDPARQHQLETVFTTGNGYFASRGTFEETYPGEVKLTLAHGLYDDMPIAFTELANLPDWLDMSITINGQPFRLDQGQVLHFQRRLYLRQALLQREVRWQAPDGTILALTFERFMSYAQEHVGAIRLLVTAVNGPCQVAVLTGINGHVSNEDLLHWHHLEQGHESPKTAWLHTRTRHTELELATAATVHTTALLSPQNCPGQPRLQAVETLQPGQTLQVDKLVSYAASRDQLPDAVGVVSRALAYLQNQTYDALKTAHLAAWDKVWQDADVIIEGDDEAQLAIRFALYQLIVAAPQHDDRVSIGAKTLSGFGYRGHVFWDTEIFVLPFFSHVLPHLARNMLLYRYHTLPGARQKASANGFRGAQFAWESAATGEEVTPTWVPDFSGKGLVRIWTGDIEIHISADIAFALHQYWQVTGDDAFMRDYGAEIILDTARFWGDRAEREEAEDGHRYAFRDVIGPDEYHDHVDNNAYTNRMAQWHLKTALEILDWLRQEYPEHATALIRHLDFTPELLAHWQDVIDHIILNHDPATGLILQFDDFFQRQPVDWSAYEGRSKSMQVLLGIEGANASQVIKQADVIMLLCLLRDQYDAETWQTNWDTYMPLTDHSYGSSLGPSFHAWAACEMGCPGEAYEHFMLAARADLADIRGNAAEGIHAASAGGLWQAIAFGFAGLRLRDEDYLVTPRLPAHWRRLAFKFYQKGQPRWIDIRVEGGETTVQQM